MQDSEFSKAMKFVRWAADKIDLHDEDISHVHITITHKDGSKTDCMQGDAGSAGVGREVTHRLATDGEIGWLRDRADKARQLLGDPRKGVSVNFSQDFTGQYIDGEPKR